MKVELIDYTTDAEWVITHAARTCYNSQDKDDLSKRGEFIQGLIKAGHETPLEFASATFDISEVSRVCQNQIVRHRIGCSYCVESERFVDVSKSGCTLPYNLQCTDDKANEMVGLMIEYYSSLVRNGVPKEDARMILPQGMHTKMCVHMSFRAIRHFLKLRLDRHAQYEVRQVAKAIYDICQEKWPWLVSDLIAE
jgi:thymidylate synthase (FAD)